MSGRSRLGHNSDVGFSPTSLFEVWLPFLHNIRAFELGGLVNESKRILKTGALAAVVTVAFAIFAYRAAEWSKGINSEMVVLGQGTTGGGNTCTTGVTGTSAVQITKVIPEIAIGNFPPGLVYNTIIQIVNTSGAAQNISANFYNEDGSAMSNVTLTAGTSRITNGVLPAMSLPKDAVFVISADGPATTAPTLGWGKVTACGASSVTTFFELRDSALNVLYSRVGVSASPANMSSFVIPVVRELATGLDVGFALVNTASGGSATVTAELKDATGTTIGRQDIIMGGLTHRQGFAYKDLFPAVNPGAGRSYQYLKFSSTSPSFAAIALAIEGGTLTSFPVEMLQ
jgi:hypothetical protein